MQAGALIWTGVICCLAALAVQLFPAAAYELSIDRVAAWQVFGFGVFLIVLGAGLSRRCPHRNDP